MASVAGDLRSFFNDPNVAYLFLALAILGILIEIITPGLYLPGTIGIIAAVIAFYALGLLSVNPLGLVLLILALPLFIFGAYLAAAFIPFTAVGIVALVTGSIYLFHAGFSIHPALIASVVIIMSVVFILVSNRVAKAQRLRVTTGREDLMCRTAVVRTPLEPAGTVLIEGEIWQAELDRGSARAGDEVTVNAIQGLKLYVTKKKGGD
jgi:membrane-bound serine protease (ClpP class)